MKKLVLWSGVALVASLQACCAFSGPKHVEKLTMAEQLEQKTVALVHFVTEGGTEIDPDDVNKPGETQHPTLSPYCTGVWVSKDTVLTAEHCVDDIGRPKVDPIAALQALLDGTPPPVPPAWSPVGQPVMYSVQGDITPKSKAWHRSHVVAVDTYSDLVLLKVDEPGDHPIAYLSANVIHDGDELHLIGHTVGLWWTYKHGYVSSHRPDHIGNDEKPHNMLQVSAPGFFGDSGGGVFDVEGNLVAMSDTIIKVPSVVFCVHRDVLRGFLEHNQVIATARR